jgi:ubiquinone/menaquinone biosynthesis C-methylase UbiE
MLDEARADLSADRRFGFWNADIQNLPSGDGCFDAVIANHMLYHVPDRTRAVSEISRVLRTGGTLYATTHGREMHKEMGRMQRVFDPARPSDAYFASPLGFSLGNGADQLSACFTDVTMKRYSDALAVTEVEPLVDYLLSGSAADAVERRTDAEGFERRVGELVGLLEHELDSQGAIRMTKATGLFVARN